MKLFETMSSIIAPSICIVCAKFGTELCEICEGKLFCDTPTSCYRCNKLSENGKTCRSCRSSSKIYAVQKLGFYTKDIREVIHSMKYSPVRGLATRLGDILASSLEINADCVSWVPTSQSRVRSRGFDHAEYIAAAVSRKTSLPLLKTLNRIGKVRQVGASREQRKHQLKGCFEPYRAHHFTGSTVLLIDDVISTGSTVEEAAEQLISAGAKRVVVAVVALNRL